MPDIASSTSSVDAAVFGGVLEVAVMGVTRRISENANFTEILIELGLGDRRCCAFGLRFIQDIRRTESLVTKRRNQIWLQNCQL
jgi:hypothetical protein